MLKLKFILKRIILKLPFGFRFNQIIRSILLLRERSFRDLFFEVKRKDICLDLGSNIGDASLVMWFKGVRFIYALEPNIEVFNILNNNLRGIRNFKALNIAISSESSTQKLYLHKSILDKSDKKKILEFSQASSLMADKSNLGNCFYEIKTKNFKDLFDSFEKKPNIIKCDIEGGEYIIYEQLIELAKQPQVRKIFVECHAEKYPQYIDLHNDFIRSIKENNLRNKFRTDWH